MSYYKPGVLEDPFPGSRLSTSYEQPAFKYISEDGSHYKSKPGTRARLVIEGETEFVNRLYGAMYRELTKIREEIKAVEVRTRR